VDAFSSDNLFWRITAQRLIVNQAITDVLPDLYELAGNEEVNSMGDNYAAVHALWTIDGLKALPENKSAVQVVQEALRHPAAGVRKAAIQILSKYPQTVALIKESQVLDDPDPNTQLEAIVSLVEIPSSDEIGKELYAMSKSELIKKDNWLSKAVYAAATKHREGFIKAFMEENPGYLDRSPTLLLPVKLPNWMTRPGKRWNFPSLLKRPDWI